MAQSAITQQAGGSKAAGSGQRTKDGGQKSEVRGQNFELRIAKLEIVGSASVPAKGSK